MTPVKSISLDEATAAQKRSFATDFLNLDVPADAGEEAIDALIAQAQPGATMIFVQDAEPSQADAPAISDESETGRMVGTLGKTDPRYTILIPVVDSDDDTGAADVVVGVNGRAWQIKRGVEVSVPARVFFALENASGDKIDHVGRGEDIAEVVTKFKRFPVQVLERPTEAELKAWHERVDDLVMA